MHSVLHLTHTDIRFDARILKEIKALRKKGWSVQGIGVDFDEGFDGAEAGIDDVVTLRIYSNFLRRFKYLPKIVIHFMLVSELTVRMFFSAMRVKHTIIHCHDTLVLPLGVLLKIATGAKLIYDAHELESNKNGLSRFLGKMTFIAERFLCKRVDGLIVVSDSILEWYKNNIDLSHKHTEVILNAPMLSQNARFDHSYLRKRFAIPHGSLLFIYVGILGEGRYIDQLLEVFSKSGFKSHIVFLGYGVYREKIVKLSGEVDNIHYHEPVSHDQVVSIVSSADVGFCLIPNVSLSDYYSLPNKMFEYIFAGVPVLASKMPEIQKLIEKHNLGICCELTVESIFAAIVQLEADGLDRIRPKIEEIAYLDWSNQEIKLNSLYSALSGEIK
ncbi:hypothetical protein Bb109J_c1525 [Bdellovibrio bacteriovorus]|uniref:glycosyltransferase n=1 Tax=Bdellovibrio bacteriovorus TaxID=959 RepID=UPI00045C0900|nr:glycosyltransferase [Bdellovibrio bacteriovorus]AHZ84220.1 hypothetical protein EP01_04590 [Bdellovibrio bacteriovorus]BEV68105.1 hypothetical protein Bb109J_c1525 [Bdellovibrio bacteriovorus]